MAHEVKTKQNKGTKKHDTNITILVVQHYSALTELHCKGVCLIHKKVRAELLCFVYFFVYFVYNDDVDDEFIVWDKIEKKGIYFVEHNGNHINGCKMERVTDERKSM